MVHNPYTDPTASTSGDRLMLIDPSASMPHLTEERLKTGGDMRLAMIYNVRALREDLRRMADLNIGYEKLTKHNLQVPGMHLPSQWLLENHTMLVRQLKSAVRGKGLYDRNVVEGLASMGIDVWYDTAKQRVGFKDGTFVALV
ncbi:hypothetical protein D3C78_1495180 [compost metagenome]